MGRNSERSGATDRLRRGAAAAVRGGFFRITVVATALFLYLPVVVVGYLSLSPGSQPSIPLDGATLRWYVAVLSDARFVRGLVTSGVIGVVAAVTGTGLGLLAARTIVRARLPRWLRAFVGVVVAIPLFIPTVVVALGIGITAGQVGLGFGLWPVVAGHLYWVLPFSTFLIASRYATIDGRMTEVARDLGADGITTFRTITLPQLWPALVASVLFAFALSFNEFLLTFFLAGSGMTTMPLEIYGKVRIGATSFLNAASVLVLLFSGAVAAVAASLEPPT
ncbi:ABC transporter permease [Halobellus salinus]|uniref:ABC transporter permease n=1 Tax=Halobellus salinus TaxID=931585 RepID=UPI001E3C716A|nr:ABC transporter permease [Halobellus salinus]